MHVVAVNSCHNGYRSAWRRPRKRCRWTAQAEVQVQGRVLARETGTSQGRVLARDTGMGGVILLPFVRRLWAYGACRPLTRYKQASWVYPAAYSPRFTRFPIMSRGLQTAATRFCAIIIFSCMGYTVVDHSVKGDANTIYFYSCIVDLRLSMRHYIRRKSVNGLYDVRSFAKLKKFQKSKNNL